MKRALVVLLLAFGLTVGGLGAASARNADPNGPQYWACVGSITLDDGVCVSNPLPPELPPTDAPPTTVPPAPSVPSLPSAPSI